MAAGIIECDYKPATPQTRYIERFVRFGKRGADMLLMGLFPNAKEITESMGAFRALITHVPSAHRSRKDYTVVVVGDGNTPRTAGLCAFYSAWRCVSVDPRMKSPLRWPVRIQRLEVHKCRIEDVPLRIDGDGAILAVHSHAPLRATLRYVTFTGSRALVAIPCCVRELPEVEPDATFSDPGIWSEKRTVHVWRDIRWPSP